MLRKVHQVHGPVWRPNRIKPVRPALAPYSRIGAQSDPREQQCYSLLRFSGYASILVRIALRCGMGKPSRSPVFSTSK